MMNYNKDTRNKIQEAAVEEFETKGYHGARMQSIADRAGINKALLHYYFKNKDELFQIIIKQAYAVFIPELISIFNNNESILSNIEDFVSAYIDLFIHNPGIPGFIIQEINNNPERLVNLLQSSGLDTGFVEKKIKEAVVNGIIIDIDPAQLIINIIALCLFPFVARPIVRNLILKGDDMKFDSFTERRKKDVAQFIIRAIKK
jgi:AcrR family transcriptional regulator